MADSKNQHPKKAESSDTPINITSLRFWAAVIKELGLPAFFVLFLSMFFLWFATKEQKEAFIDEFFLFRDVNKNPYPFAFVVLALILIIFALYFYFNKIIKRLEEENKRLENLKVNKSNSRSVK